MSGESPRRPVPQWAIDTIAALVCLVLALLVIAWNVEVKHQRNLDEKRVVSAVTVNPTLKER